MRALKAETEPCAAHMCGKHQQRPQPPTSAPAPLLSTASIDNLAKLLGLGRQLLGHIAVFVGLQVPVKDDGPRAVPHLRFRCRPALCWRWPTHLVPTAISPPLAVFSVPPPLLKCYNIIQTATDGTQQAMQDKNQATWAPWDLRRSNSPPVSTSAGW